MADEPEILPNPLQSSEGDNGGEKRGRGRPTNAELDARRQALADREAALAEREREVELRIAEENLAQRERDLEAAEVKAAARPGSAREGNARTEPLTAPVRSRRYSASDMPNEFHIPDDQIPEGASYQWNNHTVFGQSNPSYDSFMQMQSWEPVPAKRHPHLMPPNTDPGAPIIVKGQILVERPRELTQEALTEEYHKAVGEVRRKEEQLYGPAPDGQFQRARANGDTAGMVQVQKAIEPGAPVKPNYQYGDGPAGPVVE